MHHLANVVAFILLSLVSCVFSSSYCLPSIDATYDYVVIGSGTSGLATAARPAARPAANSSVSVALVEASGYYEILNSALYQVLRQYKPLERILLIPI